MAKARLTDDEIERIVALLISWQGKLSWELLTERVETLLKRPFTRQGLDKQDNIRTAFQQAKDRLRSSPVTPSATEMSTELAMALGRVERLEAEVAVLKAERNRFLEKFATWQYNARSSGRLSESDLNIPLPKVERDRSTAE
ncbi:hypothetical protein [Rhizobium leguminosarum]|uniref:hypothetical protein n=1 Tax=Rhizobium leguminosarum TaxID=384 RepID=UPI001F1F62D7|nr:hypothetical protein [Rhizobium leguminosarum]UIJ81943.1 hypothetical protein LZK78_11995 [Rhizobium leguminosarum]